MKTWHMIIDVEKCEDCNNCFLACKDEHVDNEWPGYAAAQPLHGQRWMDIKRKERGQYPLIDVAYLPVPCMHCDNAPCVKAAKDNAVYRRADGIVIIDPKRAIDQRAVVDACPYDVIWWNPGSNLPQKCTFCAHLLDDGWKQPRCVQACPTGALEFFQASDPEIQEMVAAENLEILHPKYQTKPRVYFKNLYRHDRCFIGGSVAVAVNGVTDCADGAEVRLIKDAQVIAETTTDSFGDFKLDGLAENSGPYKLVIELQGRESKEIEIDLKTSINIGDLRI